MSEAAEFLSQLQAHFPQARLEPPAAAGLRSRPPSASGAPILESRTLTNDSTPRLHSFDPPDSPHWVARITDYGGDFQELTAHYRETTPRRKRLTTEKKTGSREQMREPDAVRSASRSKRRVRESVVMLRADTMMTLTIQENVTDLELAWSYWRKFHRRLARTYPWVRNYVTVHEAQKRGSIHFHVAIKTGGAWLPYSRAIKLWRDTIGGLGSVKFTRDTQCRERQRAGRIYSYLAKYMGKDFTQGEMNKKRYEVSRGMEKPESITLYYPIGDNTPYMLSQLLTAISGRPPATKFIIPGVIHFRSF